MDACLEEMWRMFHLSDEGKGVMAVKSNEVAISQHQMQWEAIYFCGSQNLTIQ